MSFSWKKMLCLVIKNKFWNTEIEMLGQKLSGNFGWKLEKYGLVTWSSPYLIFYNYNYY